MSSIKIALFIIVLATSHGKLAYAAVSVLEPYQQYHILNAKLTTASDEQLKQFINDYPDTPYAELIREEYLARLGLQQEWALFLNYYKNSTRNDLKCWAVLAQYKIHKKPPNDATMLPLWRVAYSQAKNCDAIFSLWLDEHPQFEQLITDRIELAMQHRSYNVARHLAKSLDNNAESHIKLWSKIRNKPSLTWQRTWQNTDWHKRIVTSGLVHGSIKQPIQAAVFYDTHQKHLNFSARQKQKILRAIILRMAQKKLLAFEKWHQYLPLNQYDDTLNDWRLRYWLSKKNWLAIVNDYSLLSNTAQRNSTQQYWYAKALIKLGRRIQAMAMLTRLSRQRHYYGFLAAQLLHKNPSLNHSKPNTIPFEHYYIKNFAGLKRAKIFYDKGEMDNAKIEIQYLLSTMNQRQHYVLAKIVNQWGWHSYAMGIANQLDHRDDLNLRFPLGYQHIVLNNAKKNQVHPALIFAMIRQESHFKKHVSSPAGASGLMQIIPSTAKQIARQLNVDYKNNKQLLTPKTNIAFGTYYIKHLGKRYGSQPVLQLAAYNAGPRAVNRWLKANNAMEADLWIEHIPYSETRNYIKNVVAYYIVYQHCLGQSPSLSHFMKYIRINNLR